MGADVQRLLLTCLVSLPAFGAGHLLREGDPGMAFRLALATLLVVLLSAALARLPQPR